jgi:KUP system potassium uptake protein
MQNSCSRSDPKYLALLAVGALGVVYGDIGTSPLYALRECFHGPHAIGVTPANVLGVLSLMLWSLILLVSVKYLSLVLRADNQGEGGILALLALAFPDAQSRQQTRSARIIVIVGIFGTALLYGDGMITPAISVLSAVEGLNVATHVFEPYIIPITAGILIALFSVQRHGTGKVGAVFGRVTIVWFLVLAVLGVKGIIAAPAVLAAVNPQHAVSFFAENGWRGFIVLGSVFLVVTGAEALYADMGHFGRRPIRLAWMVIVLPALCLNYFGQGALLLQDPVAAENPFYRLAPSWSVYPLVILATAATVIASQALISGAFSLTMQAMQLGYFPRLKIEHTSSAERGQIYIASVNRFLLLACLVLVVGFRSSSNLAAAYGIAVTLTMLITTVLFFFAARRLWGWSPALAALVCAPFLLIELAFFGANAVKILHGGWFPLLIALGIFALFTTWKTGREQLGRKLEASTLPLSLFFSEIESQPPTRVRGTAIYLSGRTGIAPISLLHNLKHNQVLHQNVILLTVLSHHRPHIPPEGRVEIEPLREGFHRLTGHYGFMEEPNVPELLSEAKLKGLPLDEGRMTFFLSKETILPSTSPGLRPWRKKVFALMARNATSAARFFKLPPNRVVELGMQVEL